MTKAQCISSIESTGLYDKRQLKSLSLKALRELVSILNDIREILAA